MTTESQALDRPEYVRICSCCGRWMTPVLLVTSNRHGYQCRRCGLTFDRTICERIRATIERGGIWFLWEYPLAKRIRLAIHRLPWAIGA